MERGLSVNTLDAYGRDLKRFAAFLERRGADSPGAAARADIVDFLMSERERGLSVNSVSRSLVAIKVFFAFLQREGLLDRNVTEAMDSPRLWKVLPGVLSAREVGSLLASPVGDGRCELRDRAILELMYATGLRVSETAALTLENLHFDAGYLRCVGKGNKERVVPFGSAARLALERYLAESRPMFASDASPREVFLTCRGRGFTRKGIWKMIRRHARRAGIRKNVSPHTLRHSFASHMLANGAPLRVIQEMLGHADIATTQVYTHVDQGRLQAVHSRFHPRA
jgi:integrase/recombinase XerD